MPARLALAFCLVASTAQAATPVVLSDRPDAPNGAWCWFQSERAIVDDSDPENPLLLVGSVSSSGTKPDEHGDIDVLWLNLESGERGVFELHDQLESDDHDSPSLWRRPDGRYVAAYSKHCGDRLVRWRVSTRPGDPTEWEPEETVDALPDAPGGDATYTNLHALAGGLLFNFTRSDSWDPNVLVSRDDGATWAYGGKLLTCGGGGDRPYLRYASRDGVVHFVATEEHPRQGRTSLYHGVVRGGALYDSMGDLVDESVLDADGVAVERLTPVYRSGDWIGDGVAHRAWVSDVAIGNDGAPVVVFTARVDDDPHHHLFAYARWDGGAWKVNALAPAGGYLYRAEDDYTGLASIDPDDTATVYLSSPIDPRSGAPTDHYEIYRATTPDGGETWRYDAITEDSAVDNLRPLAPNWPGDQAVIVWMRGDYRTYRDWDTQAVALVLPRLNDSD